jgi:hypothetical protein
MFNGAAGRYLPRYGCSQPVAVGVQFEPVDRLHRGLEQREVRSFATRADRVVQRAAGRQRGQVVLRSRRELELRPVRGRGQAVGLQLEPHAQAQLPAQRR